MLLSVCSICKDEEEFLPGFLENVLPHVDELIVVDTGSLDKSLEILKDSGVFLVHLPWEQDFSKARNESLRHAKADFILVLDIDERLQIEDWKRLRSCLLSLKEDMLYMPIHNLLEVNWHESTYCSDTQMNIRLIRNRCGLYFKGKIHEVVEDHATDKRVGNLEIPILHLGYAGDRREKKSQRNMEMILDGYSKDPEDPFYGFYYALSQMGKVDIRPLLKKALSKAENALRYQIACELLEDSLHHGDMEEFHNTEKILEAMKADCAVLWYLRAKLALQSNRLLDARTNLEKARQGLETEVYLQTSLLREIYQNLIVVMAMQGELNASDTLLQKLLTKVPLDPFLFYLGLKISFARKDKGRFFQLLMQAPDKELHMLSESQRLEIAQWMRAMGQM